MTLHFRAPRLEDEAQATAAETELAAEGHTEFFRSEGEAWGDYIEREHRESAGVDLPEGRVPASMLFAFEGNELVGRVHIRHRLNDYLLLRGGHIGYAVRPAFRRRGTATHLLQVGLDHLRGLGVDRALVTCDDDNVASSRTIERCGGLLENTVALSGEPAVRRYWINLA